MAKSRDVQFFLFFYKWILFLLVIPNNAVYSDFMVVDIPFFAHKEYVFSTRQLPNKYENQSAGWIDIEKYSYRTVGQKRTFFKFEWL